ncbi:hypothetical protein SCLCIDRAFT_122268 [Scleroderma citrinum Foug A]|uniref:Peptidase M20 dimerisation domain-containing protein n=1 Tax=Scleroderma citrinum Foug A TaxID=1036808 RepID=A0A0C3A8W3_9AGAM|nr:hypothetical protein SCLCIDRAFT_122268 [Scleroderma citrinum Foug A]
MLFSILQLALSFLWSHQPTTSPCPQWDALHPQSYARLEAELENAYASERFKLRTYEVLSGAIRILTESFDGSGPVGEDPVWNTFADFHEYLERVFPRVYARLEVTKVNTYGLVYHWKGSTDVKPILGILTSSADVVPVDPSTVSQWKYPPYSGHYDGTWIWGRGACDDKEDLIQRLVTVDTLLEHGFSPARTIVLAFGFDEETTGKEGAGHIAKYLEETYGRDGFALILDEGGQVGDFGNGLYVASPMMSEKGYMDVRVEVTSAGGHSSLPPEHTSIGLLAHAISTIEANPHVPQLLRNGTPFTTVQCLAEYSPLFPDSLRPLARRAVTDDSALSKLTVALANLSPSMKAMMTTTQAVDIIEGGVKVNALPERASAIINHRIAEHSSVAELQQHIIGVLSPVVALHDLTLKAFGRTISTGSSGEMVLSDAFDSALEPSPVTPAEYGPYSILGGTVKATMMTSTLYNATEVIVVPSLLRVALKCGVPDTMYYWNLTKHIFRFMLVTEADWYSDIHTINEAVRAESVIEGIRFLTKFILNVDESFLP